MKNDPLKDMILKQFNPIARGANLPSGIQFLQGEGDTVVMALSHCAMGVAPKKNLNMQCDEAAFEAWALLIHVHCGFRVELTWKKEPEVKAYRGHYGRFLYRAMKFSEQYPDWFSLSPALKDRVEAFRAYLHAHHFCNNVPASPASTNGKLENHVETLFAGECAPVLRATAQRSGISLTESPCRQLPVGLFEEVKSAETCVFTGRKSAIDLWTVSGDSIVIFELKAKNPKAGILSELMFYANYMADMYINHTFNPVESKTSYRGYKQLFPLRFRHVQAAMLTDRLHPLITPDVLETMNRGVSNIQYYNLHYILDENGRPTSGDPT